MLGMFTSSGIEHGGVVGNAIEMVTTEKLQVVAIWVPAVVILSLSFSSNRGRRPGIIILHNMTYPRVHWKGVPHNHPQIRVISSHSSARNRTSAQIAAEQVLCRPFSPPLIKARRRQFCKVFLRTRRSANSRRSSSTIITIRKRTSRAKHNLQVYGWDSSTAEVANYIQTRHRPSAIHISTSAQPRSVLPAHLVIRKPMPIPSIDGAACSTSRQPSEKDKGGEVTVNFHKAPLFATTNHILPRITKQSPTGSSFSPRPHTICSSRGQEGRHRTYDSRITPVNRLKGEQYLHLNTRPAGSWPVPTRPTEIRRPTHPQTTSTGNPRRSIALAAQRPLISTIGSNITANSNRESISRTPSERKALKKFTRELEIHLQAAKDLRQRASLASLPSITTTISVRTVAELVPYKSEFHAAGLAITSDEQRGMAFGWSSKTKRAPSPPPTNITERSRYDFKNIKSSKKQARQPSYASGSTGTTVMGFTPPHEKSYDVPKTPIPRRHSSSDHTVLGFTPPHEIVARVASSSPRQSFKKSLPWLRKQESPNPEFATTKKITVHEDNVIKEMRIVEEPTRSPSFFPCPKPGDDGRARQSPGSTPNPRLSPKNRKEIPAVHRELSIKEYDRVVTKQVSKSSQNKPSIVTPRTPVKSSRKTSPPHLSELGIIDKDCLPKAPQCARDCQPDPKVSMTRNRSKTPPPSRSQWKTVSNSYPEDLDDGLIPKQSSPNGDPQPKKEPESPFPFDFGFQTRSRSPKATKIENEKKQLTSNESDERWNTGSKALESIHSKQGSRTVNYKSASENINYQAKGRQSDPPVHICNARSSQACQECFPTRESSIAISPLQTPPYKGEGRPSSTPRASIYSTDIPVVDPVKRSSPSTSQRKVKRKVSSLSRPRPSPRVLNPFTNSKLAMKQAASTTSLDTYSPQASRVSDKAVFRGLHVATAAACDEDLDKWIEDLTGFSARQFLADLSKFQGLGVNALANVAKRAAKQRREEVKGWEKLRRERRGARENAEEEEDA